MAKRLLCLFLLLLIRSNAYAWYCTYTPTTEGYISNLQCYDIDPTLAVKDYWCPYRNADPICRQFDQPVIPICSDHTEVQSISCPVHYSGVINQSRTYHCQTASYTDWITTSNNCTADPPTCHVSVEERQVACTEGYVGSITQQRTSSCPDPYGQPIFGAWAETQNTCEKSITNVTNPASPVSPIMGQAMESVPSVDVTTAPVEMPQVEVKVEATVEVKTEVKQESSPSSPTAASPAATPTTNVAGDKTEVKETPKIDVPKGKELVPGFGIVMSIEILNAPIKFQEQQFITLLDYTQELDDGVKRSQGYLLEFINDSYSNNLFNIGNMRWNDLRRHNDVQPCYSCD